MNKSKEEELREWEVEFDKLLAPDGDTINQILEYRGIWDCGKCFMEDEQERYIKPIKEFIRNLLASHQLEMEKKVAVKRKDITQYHGEDEVGYAEGYNSAIDDTLSILRGDK